MTDHQRDSDLSPVPPVVRPAGTAPTPEPMAYPDGRPHEDQPKWRRDFPLQRPEGDYVSRRDFAKFMVLTSGAFVVGHVYIAGKSVAGGRAGPYPRVAVINLADIPVGKAITFEYPDHDSTCIMVRIDESTVVAYSQKCTHLDCAVQPDVDRGRFNCPCHHAFFDIESGRPISGPPRRPLPRVELEVSDGVVYAVGVEYRT